MENIIDKLVTEQPIAQIEAGQTVVVVLKTGHQVTIKK